MSGGFLAAVMFELSKIWFVFYVTHISTFEHIYGALSVIPMLFFWIYLGWVVVLTGAEFVFCLGALKPLGGVVESFNPLRGVPVILSVLGLIWNGQKNGRSMNMKKILKMVYALQPSDLRKIIDILLQHDVVHITANGDLAVSRDLYVLTLYDLYAILPPGFTSDENASLISEGNSVHLETIRKGVSDCLKNTLNMPVAALLEDINQEHL